MIYNKVSTKGIIVEVKSKIKIVKDGAMVAIECDCTVHVSEKQIKEWIQDKPLNEPMLSRNEIIKHIALNTWNWKHPPFNPRIVGVHAMTKEEVLVRKV